MKLSNDPGQPLRVVASAPFIAWGINISLPVPQRVYFASVVGLFVVHSWLVRTFASTLRDKPE